MTDQTTFREWFNANLIDSAADIANHGADGGFNGIIYTAELVELHDKYEEELWDEIRDDAEEYGHKTMMEFIASWIGAPRIGGMDDLKVFVVWYMCEKVAHEIVNERENEESAA